MYKGSHGAVDGSEGPGSALLGHTEVLRAEPFPASLLLAAAHGADLAAAVLDAVAVAAVLARAAVLLAQPLAAVRVAQIVALRDALAAFDLAVLGRPAAVRLVVVKLLLVGGARRRDAAGGRRGRRAQDVAVGVHGRESSFRRRGFGPRPLACLLLMLVQVLEIHLLGLERRVG